MYSDPQSPKHSGPNLGKDFGMEGNTIRAYPMTTSWILYAKFQTNYMEFLRIHEFHAGTELVKASPGLLLAASWSCN